MKYILWYQSGGEYDAMSHYLAIEAESKNAIRDELLTIWCNLEDNSLYNETLAFGYEIPFTYLFSDKVDHLFEIFKLDEFFDRQLPYIVK